VQFKAPKDPRRSWSAAAGVRRRRCVQRASSRRRILGARAAIVASRGSLLFPHPMLYT
jgi:hypothetical protein